jgi:predicted permease
MGWGSLRFRRRSVRASVDDEIRFHFQERIEALISEGMSPEAAATRAREEFGNVDEIRRGLTAIDARVATGRRWSRLRDIFGQDVRYAIRTLAATPAFTVIVVATLALGIGANAATFSLVDRLLFRPPAGVGNPSEVQRLYRNVPADSIYAPGWLHYPGFQDIAMRLPPDMAAAAYTNSHVSIGRGEAPLKAHVAWVTPRYFSLLQVGPPALGRYFTDAEAAVDRPSALAVLSHAQWWSQFGGNVSVIGSTIELSQKTYTIVGVASPAFAGVDVDAIGYWLTIGSYRTDAWYRLENDGVRVLVRGGHRSPDQVAAIVTEAFHAGDPNDRSQLSLLAGPLSVAAGPMPFSTEVSISTRLAGVALLVLLIACANVGNLLLSRGLQRRGELAIRLALGMSRMQLVRLLLVESLVLSVLAAVVSLIAAAWGGVAIGRLLLPEVDWAGPILDVRILLFTFLLAITAGLVTGLLPALRAARVGVASALKTGAGDGTASRLRSRSALLVMQLALSLVLLVGAGAFVRSLLTVQSIRTGYDTDRLLLVRLRYDDGVPRGARTAELLQDLAERLRTHPGVEDTALSAMPPLSGWSMVDLFRLDGSPVAAGESRPSYMSVTPRFFRTAGIDLLRGRDFGAEDAPTAPPVMIVNDTMARALWPGADPLAQCLRIRSATEPCAAVVGVVGNTNRDGLIDRAEGLAPMYFVPSAQSRGEFARPVLAIVRSADPRRTAALAEALQSRARQTLPDGVYAAVTPLTDNFRTVLRPWILGSTLFTAFGLLALIVASIGTYSALAYSVSRRRREMGIRLALGAPPINLLRLVVGEGLLPVAIGIGAGLAITLAAGRAIASMLYRTSPSDPIVIAVAIAVLTIAATLGSLVPALRASRVDPISILRSE